MKLAHASFGVVCLLVVVACGSGGDSAPGPSSLTYVDSPGGELVLSGVRIEIDSSVHYVYHSRSSSEAGTELTMTVDGHDFGLRDGVFFIGDVEYGAVTEGDTVVVAAEGIQINGERHGDMPAAVTDG